MNWHFKPKIARRLFTYLRRSVRSQKTGQEILYNEQSVKAAWHQDEQGAILPINTQKAETFANHKFSIIAKTVLTMNDECPGGCCVH